MYISVKDGKIVVNDTPIRSDYINYRVGESTGYVTLDAFCIINDKDRIRCSFKTCKKVTVVEFCKRGLNGRSYGRSSLATISALGSTNEPGINSLMNQLSLLTNNSSLDDLSEEIEQEFVTYINDIMAFARGVYPDMVDVCRRTLFISGLPVDTFGKIDMKSSRSAE